MKLCGRRPPQSHSSRPFPSPTLNLTTNLLPENNATSVVTTSATTSNTALKHKNEIFNKQSSSKKLLGINLSPLSLPSTTEGGAIDLEEEKTSDTEREEGRRMFNVMRPHDKVSNISSGRLKEGNDVPRKSVGRSLHHDEDTTDVIKNNVNDTYTVNRTNPNYRLKKQHHGSSIGTIQRPLGGGGSGGVGDIRGARSSSSKKPVPSRLNPNTCLSLEPQIPRSQETNQQKENIGGSTKKIDLMDSNFLQDELVKAVKTHFQDRNWQKIHSTNANKVPSDASMHPPKDDSSDDEIEVLEEKIVHRPSNPFGVSHLTSKNSSKSSSINGSTTKRCAANGVVGASGAATKTSVSVPIKLSKEWQAKFCKALRAKGTDSLSGNAIELFSAESGGDTSLLEALKGFTDRRITKCSFVFPEKLKKTRRESNHLSNRQGSTKVLPPISTEGNRQKTLSAVADNDKEILKPKMLSPEHLKPETTNFENFKTTETTNTSLPASSLDALNKRKNFDVNDHNNKTNELNKLTTVTENGVKSTQPPQTKKTTLNCIQLSPPIAPSVPPSPSSVVHLSPPLPPPSSSVRATDTVCPPVFLQSTVQDQENNVSTITTTKGKHLTTSSTNDATEIEESRPSIDFSNGIATRNNSRQPIPNIPPGSSSSHPRPGSISVNVNDVVDPHLPSKCVSAFDLLLQTCSPKISASESTSKVVIAPTAADAIQSFTSTTNIMLQNKEDLSNRSTSPKKYPKTAKWYKPKDASHSTRSRSSSPEIIILDDDDDPPKLHSSSISKTSSIDSSKHERNRLCHVASNNEGNNLPSHSAASLHTTEENVFDAEHTSSVSAKNDSGKLFDFELRKLGSEPKLEPRELKKRRGRLPQNNKSSPLEKSQLANGASTLSGNEILSPKTTISGKDMQLDSVTTVSEDDLLDHEWINDNDNQNTMRKSDAMATYPFRSKKALFTDIQKVSYKIIPPPSKPQTPSNTDSARNDSSLPRTPSPILSGSTTSIRTSSNKANLLQRQKDFEEGIQSDEIDNLFLESPSKTHNKTEQPSKQAETLYKTVDQGSNAHETKSTEAISYNGEIINKIQDQSKQFEAYEMSGSYDKHLYFQKENRTFFHRRHHMLLDKSTSPLSPMKSINSSEKYSWSTNNSTTMEPLENEYEDSPTDNNCLKKQPRIVLKMKKSQLGNRWYHQSGRNGKPKPSSKKRSPLKKMKIRFLSTMANLICKQSGKLFVNNSLFSELLSNIKLDTKCLTDSLKFDSSERMDMESHLLFENWTISHISLQAALRLCSFMNSGCTDSHQVRKRKNSSNVIPNFLSRTLNQLRRKPQICLKRLEDEDKRTTTCEDKTVHKLNLDKEQECTQEYVNISDYNEHDQQLFMDSSNFSSKPKLFKSKRIKHPTAKLIDSDLSFGTNSCLLASFSSEEDVLNTSGGSNGALSPVKLTTTNQPVVEKSFNHINEATDGMENKRHKNRHTSAPFKQSKMLSDADMSALKSQLQDTYDKFSMDILLSNESTTIGENTANFISENGWRFSGKLKPLYRHFTFDYPLQTRIFQGRSQQNRSTNWRCTQFSIPCKFFVGDNSSGWNHDLLTMSDDEVEISKQQHTMSRSELNSRNAINFPSPPVTRALFPIEHEQISITTVDTTDQSCQTEPKINNKHLNHTELVGSEISDTKYTKAATMCEKSLSSSPKLIFKVPQNINLKLKRRRLDEDATNDETYNVSNNDVNQTEVVDISSDKNCIAAFRKPYKPRKKRVILARASIPRKTVSSGISEISFDRNNIICSPPKRKIRPVRKFSSNSQGGNHHLIRKSSSPDTPPSEVGERDLINDTTAINTITNGEKAVKKVVIKTHAIDMPTFTLAGIAENKPRELEGWFTNKLFQLKKMSSEPTNNSSSINSTNFNNHGNNTGSNYNGFVTLNKLSQKKRDKTGKSDVKVKYSEGAYQIVDLEEYKVLLLDKKSLETDKKETPDKGKFDEELSLDESSTEDMSNFSLPFATAKNNFLTTDFLTNSSLKSFSCGSANNGSNVQPVNNGSNSSVAELLKVARRIEKISNQGIGRSRSSLRDASFLPKGWMKVIKRKSFQNFKSPKIIIKTCTEYVNDDGKTFDSLSSALRFIAREKVIMRQRKISY